MPLQEGETIEGFMKSHHLFWIFRPCIDGFQYGKSVVQVDGIWLYGKYKGALLVIVAQAWISFLKNLKRHVTLQDGQIDMS